MDFTIVTGVTPDYMQKLKWSLKTWPRKPQFKDKPLIVFHSREVGQKDLGWVKDYFPNHRCIQWNLPSAESQRELMLSCFILGVKYIETNYWVKIDADALFTDNKDVFEKEDLEYDLVSHKWGYTKPGWWVDHLENEFCGASHEIDRSKMDRRNDPRIISWCCLHKTEFVKEVAERFPEKLPVPSHDTTLWFFAEHWDHRKWRAKNLKRRGVDHKSTFRGLREAVCASTGESIDKSIYNNVQLEVTTECQLGCFNCDRNCGVAPSTEYMTSGQLWKFVEESLVAGHKWKRIDIIGGEPTYYPKLDILFKFMQIYRNRYGRCKFRFSTNGLGDRVAEGLEQVPEWVAIRNSAKDDKKQNFEAYNSAPIDHGHTKVKPCSIPWRCGLGLTRYGYFPCGAGASIARVFGLDIGVRHLKDYTVDKIQDQLNILCSLCGHANVDSKHKTSTPEMSPTWKNAIRDYNKEKPKMTEY